MKSHKINGNENYRIAIIGCGPRGISVLERITARLVTEREKGLVANNFEVYVIDSHNPGSGRIWDPEQSPFLLMNTPAKETTIFSGPQSNDVVCPGSGPSLEEWWEKNSLNHPFEDGLAARHIYGQYLNYAFQKILAILNEIARVEVIKSCVRDIKKINNKNMLLIDNEMELIVDEVVLSTGHQVSELKGKEKEFFDFCQSHSGLNFFEGNSAAEMPLEKIKPQEHVGIIGCGLAFFDVMALLTEGRDGKYYTDNNGELIYLPSGNEPKIVAGSRSGVPFPARAVNQKKSDYQYIPKIFNKQLIDDLKANSINGKLDFKKELIPWLEAEMQLVYCSCHLINNNSHVDIPAFQKLAICEAIANPEHPKKSILDVAMMFGMEDKFIVDLYKWSKPFDGQQFSNRSSYEDALINWINSDINNARKGNVSGAIKATTDVLRDIRPVIKYAVDYSGLNPESHKKDFIGSFNAMYSLLSAGPPLIRLRQVIALMKSGILSFAGPNMEITISAEKKCFEITSPQIITGGFYVTSLVDARIPSANVNKNSSPLYKNLLASEIIKPYFNFDDLDSFETGGIHVTKEPFNVISKNGIDRSIYVIGIPIEHTRWLMQFGSGRPGNWNQFTCDADAVAKTIVANLINATKIS